MKSIKLYFLFLALMCLQGCDTAFEVELTGKKVTLLAPANNLITSDSTQVFYWETLKGATEYRLQVVSPRFDSIVKLIEDTTIRFDRFEITGLDTGIYQWRVKALNSASATEHADTWNIKIQ